MNRSTYLWVPALALPLLAGGCSQSELVNATGRVTYQGKPVPNTYVTFLPIPEGKRPSRGVTDDNGDFALQFTRGQPGVVRGKHKVGLRYRTAADEEEGRPRVSEELRSVIARYQDPGTSKLEYEVTSNGQHFDIKLE